MSAPPLEQRWRLPHHVHAEQGKLIYTLSTHETAGESDPDEPDMLRKFLTLADADDETIADYAHDFGVLGLCSHGYPSGWTHWRKTRDFRKVERYAPRSCAPLMVGTEPVDLTIKGTCYPNAGYRDVLSEPLQAWRDLSRALGALLTISAQVDSNQPSTAEQRQELAHFTAGVWLGDERTEETWRQRHGLAAQITLDKEAVASTLELLLQDSVRVTVNWPRSRTWPPRLRFAGRSLADALVIQTAMTISRAESTMTCDGCGTIFVPSGRYKPRAGQRRFCDACRAAGVPAKLANRDRRARERSAKEES